MSHFGFLAIGLSLALLGCSRDKPVPKRVAEGWIRGETAIVEPTAADFYEGQILEVTNGKLKVQRSEGGENLLVGVADAYRIPKVPPRLASGAWAICRERPHLWVACRITGEPAGAGATAVQGAVAITATDVLGNELRVADGGSLIEPSGLTAMNIQRRFEQSSRRFSFEKAIRDAGEPRRQPGWQPVVRRAVLARQQGKWFSGQVVDTEDKRVVVRWEGQQATTDLAREDVAPHPPACGAVQRGDRALRRPPGQGAPWIPTAVISIDGADAVVEDVERTRTTVPVRDLCALGVAATEAPAK